MSIASFRNAWVLGTEIKLRETIEDYIIIWTQSLWVRILIKSWEKGKGWLVEVTNLENWFVKKRILIS